jgi:hypothetical protein
MKSIYLAFAILFSINPTFAQTTLLTGKILKAGTEEPIIGARISIKGTNRGTFTDHMGLYTLNVADKHVTLTVMYKRMRTIESAINTQGMLKKVINFEMVGKYDLVKMISKKKEKEEDNSERLSLMN